MFSAHYYEIPDGYKLKMRINDMHGANQKRFVPTPKLASIQKAAKSAGFDKKVVFTNLGLAGVTKFYKYKDYGEPKGQLISKCPFGFTKSTKKPTKIFVRISAPLSTKNRIKKVV